MSRKMQKGATPFTPSVYYRDPKAALEWLSKAFGFETSMMIPDEEGGVMHAEMRYGEGVMFVGPTTGASILIKPEDQFYGDRTYRVSDCEVHVWTFGQYLRDFEG